MRHILFLLTIVTSGVAAGQPVPIWTIAERQTTEIYSVAFSPDETQLASGSEDHGIRLWDVNTGREIRRFAGRIDEVHSVAFSPDGSQLASGSEDHGIRLWDVNTGREIRRFAGRIDEVHSVAFSPDGSQLASGSEDHGIRLWDVNTGREIRRFAGHIDEVHSVAFSPDGSQLASGSEDHGIRLWDVNTGHEIRRFARYADEVYSVAFSPDGSQLASGSEDYGIRLWDVNTGDEIRRFAGRRDEVYSIAFSPDGSKIVSGSEYGSVRIWDVATGQELDRFEHRSSVYSIAVSSGGRFIVSAGSRSIKLWNASGTLEFTGDIADQEYSLAQPIIPLILPRATAGLALVKYQLTPALPAGLSFDASERTISGIPTVATSSPVKYTYTATASAGIAGGNLLESAKSLEFTVHVSSSVSVKHESLPKAFALAGNYPNPFQEATQVMFDLPWPAHVHIEVMDITGRHISTIPGRRILAGGSRTIEISGESLPAGVYIYRLIANSFSGKLSVQTGSLVRTR